MPDPRYPQATFSPDDIRRLSPALKVGLLATVNPQGLPHLTMISTLMAASPQQVVWGQFMEGLSKQHVHLNPKTGFLVMTLDKIVWRGQAIYTETRRDGPHYNHYNTVPMFRYNAYFGIHTVHYMELRGHTGPQPLPLNRMTLAAIQTLFCRKLSSRPPASQPVMNAWTRSFLDKLDNLKFLSYVNRDGFPVIIPAIQAQTLDPGRVVFSTGVYADELAAIPLDAPLAVFGLSLSMEDVLLRGEYRGVRRLAGVPCGIVELNWAYNSMPPIPGQIYPRLPLNPVKDFSVSGTRPFLF